MRAGIAALVAVGVLVAFALAVGVDAALRTRSEEARDAGERADAQLIARRVEAVDGGLSDARLSAILGGMVGTDGIVDIIEDDPVKGSVAVGVYEAPGHLLFHATSPGFERLDEQLPREMKLDQSVAPPRLDSTFAERTVGTRYVSLRGDRWMLVVHDRRPLTPWADTFVAYQSLTLIVVVAGILFLVWRIGRHSPAARRDAIASGGAGDAPSREADFVVETFQTVIGELQHKGKELERRSQRDRERADRSERFAERVIAQMPTGLVVVDRSGCVTAANQSARDLFAGLPSGRSEAVVQERVFESAPGLSAMIAGCLAEGQSFQRREVELRAQTGDGSTRCLGVSVTPIGPAGGPVEAALALMTDLTEVVELRDRVRAQETLASLGEMAAGLTHELKNSLATIQGYAQLLAGMDVERAAEPSEALMTEVRALSQMVTDFLNFAKPQDLSLAPVRIRDVIEAIVDRFGDRLASSGIEAVISGDAAGGSATVWADEMLLSRAILNLFQNAIEALEEIDGPRKIEISVRESGPTELTLEIRDNGPGIPPEDLSRVFIPFFTTRSRGYGIGLALTQKIIFAHGGRITVENADPGAVFRCRLPSREGRPTA